MQDVHALPAKPAILVVDDTPDNLTLMSALLKDSYPRFDPARYHDAWLVWL